MYRCTGTRGPRGRPIAPSIPYFMGVTLRATRKLREITRSPSSTPPACPSTANSQHAAMRSVVEARATDVQPIAAASRAAILQGSLPLTQRLSTAEQREWPDRVKLVVTVPGSSFASDVVWVWFAWDSLIKYERLASTESLDEMLVHLSADGAATTPGSLCESEAHRRFVTDQWAASKEARPRPWLVVIEWKANKGRGMQSWSDESRETDVAALAAAARISATSVLKVLDSMGEPSQRPHASTPRRALRKPLLPPPRVPNVATPCLAAGAVVLHKCFTCATCGRQHGASKFGSLRAKATRGQLPSSMTPAQQHLITQFFTSRGVDESKLATLSSPALHFVNSPTRRHSFTRELTEALAMLEATRCILRELDGGIDDEICELDHEIKREIHRKASPCHIVDLCCGTSFVSVILGVLFPTCLISAVDIIEPTRLPHFAAAGLSNVRYTQMDLLSPTFVGSLDELIQAAGGGRRTILLGMHLCGELSTVTIRAFHALHRSVEALVLAPCCLPNLGRVHAACCLPNLGRVHAACGLPDILAAHAVEMRREGAEAASEHFDVDVGLDAVLGPSGMLARRSSADSTPPRHRSRRQKREERHQACDALRARQLDGSNQSPETMALHRLFQTAVPEEQFLRWCDYLEVLARSPSAESGNEFPGLEPSETIECTREEVMGIISERRELLSVVRKRHTGTEQADHASTVKNL